MDPFADLIPQNNTQKSSVPTPFDDLIPGRQSVAPSSSAPTAVEEKHGTRVGNLFRGIATAPATIVARPFQAIAELAGASAEDVDKFTQKYTGGLVAPVPQNAGDVKKDVGRAVQTVALGTGAPVAGGAAFGLGSSLEQGNDLFSAETLINTALGGAGGKVLDWVGKPIFNAAGKVIGTITPQTIKEVAGKGANYIKKFAEQHELLNGVAKPLSEKIASGFQAVDDKTGELFKGAGSKVKDAVSKEYPGLSKESRQNAAQDINKKLVLQPVQETNASYNKATRVYNNAKERGINLEEVIPETNTFHHEITDKGKFSTLDKADAIENETMDFGNSVVRQALKEAEPGVQRVTISDIRQSMIKKVDSIPPSQITPEERRLMKEQINEKYGDDSAAARDYKNGYSLTDLHDNRIISQKRGKYKYDGSFSETLNAERNRYEGQVFSHILDTISPQEAGLQSVRREMEKRFVLSNYLRELNNKKVPIGAVGKASRLFGRALGATVGAKAGGGAGAIFGSRFGDVLFDWLENVPSPIRTRMLNSIKNESPQAYKELIKYIESQQSSRSSRLALPAGDKSKANYPAIELGPKTMSAPNKTGNDIQQNSRRLFNTKQLPAPTTIFKGPTQNGLPYTENPRFSTTPVVKTKTVKKK